MSSAETTTPIEEEVSRAKKVISFIGWSIFFFLFLISFTVLKMPQDKIHRWVIGTLNQQVSMMGMQISADEGSIGFGPSLQYEMKGIKVSKFATNKVLVLSKLSISPAFRGLLEGKLGADIKIEEGSGLIEGSVFIKGQDMDLKLDIQGVNLGRIGALSFFTGLEGTLELRGDIDLRGNTQSLSSFEGTTKLLLSRIRIDEQMFRGFQIPLLNIADGAINTSFSSGRLNLSDVRLGKLGGTDDLKLVAGGSIKLGQYIYNSDLDLKMKLGISKPLPSSYTVIIDMILGPMKQPDGTFAFKLSGPIESARPEADPSP